MGPADIPRTVRSHILQNGPGGEVDQYRVNVDSTELNACVGISLRPAAMLAKLHDFYWRIHGALH
jgi:hypothetical protein